VPKRLFFSDNTLILLKTKIKKTITGTKKKKKKKNFFSDKSQNRYPIFINQCHFLFGYIDLSQIILGGVVCRQSYGFLLLLLLEHS
jgi:hypothetical protein